MPVTSENIEFRSNSRESIEWQNKHIGVLTKTQLEAVEAYFEFLFSQPSEYKPFVEDCLRTIRRYLSTKNLRYVKLHPVISDKNRREQWTSRVLRNGWSDSGEYDWSKYSPEERITTVWELTRICYLWQTGDTKEPRLEKSIVQIMRQN